MGMIITATCGGKSVSIECRRPSWESVREAYKYINEVGSDSNDTAESRYTFLGGKIENAFKKERKSYTNTCAVRISYALNYGGMPIKKSLENPSNNQKLNIMKNQIETYGRIDKNSNYYITSSIDMEAFLWIKWGVPEFLQKNMINQTDNENAFEKLRKLNKQGVATMRISFLDAQGHTTLWNKECFTDGTNYLTGYCK